MEFASRERPNSEWHCAYVPFPLAREPAVLPPRDEFVQSPKRLDSRVIRANEVDRDPVTARCLSAGPPRLRSLLLTRPKEDTVHWLLAAYRYPILPARCDRIPTEPHLTPLDRVQSRAARLAAVERVFRRLRERSRPDRQRLHEDDWPQPAPTCRCLDASRGLCSSYTALLCVFLYTGPTRLVRGFAQQDY